jgi:segregation and condensation protein B
MIATTKTFLDYFGLKKLDDLPPLADLSDWESLRVQLNLPAVDDDAAGVDADIPKLPVLYPEAEDDEVEDEPELMSDLEIDAVNRRVPELVAVEFTDEPAVDFSQEEDQDASARGG